MTRTINLQLTSEDMIQIANILADDDRTNAYAKLWAAVGYLSSWGNTINMTYPSVTIYRDRDTDLVAAYKKEDGSNGYVIGAVWNGTNYGFHS